MKKDFEGLGVKESEIMPSEYGIKLFLILSYVILFILCASSCMSDRTALQRVFTKQPLFDTVGTVYTQLHPCDNKVIKAKSDTIIKHDSSISYEPYYIDCPDVYDTSKPKQIKVLVPVKTYINNTRIIDSITRVDNQQISILKSQIEQYKQQIAAINQSVTDARLSTVQEHSRGNHWQLYFWIAVALIAILLFLLIKSLAKL